MSDHPGRNRVPDWCADHRVPVRIALAVLDLAVLAYVVLDLASGAPGGFGWVAIGALVGVWGGVTALFGFILPAAADRRRGDRPG